MQGSSGGNIAESTRSESPVVKSATTVVYLEPPADSVSSVNSVNSVSVLREKVRDLLTERTQLVERVAELEAALAPFAERVLKWGEKPQGKHVVVPLRMVEDAAKAYAGLT